MADDNAKNRENRDKIKTPQGPKWLTVPVIKKDRYFQQIRDVEIKNQDDWRQVHINIIQAVICMTYQLAGLFCRCIRRNRIVNIIIFGKGNLRIIAVNART